MGNASKMFYRKEEYLCYHISRKQYSKISQILDSQPELIDKPLTKDSKHTLLMRAVFSSSPESVDFVLNKGANPNIVTPKGQTALTISVSKNQYEMVQKLIEKGADANFKNSKGLKPIDLAILQGLMDIAKLLYQRMKSKQLKEPFEYQDLGKKYNYRYVNYKQFLTLLISEQQKSNQRQTKYLKKQKPQLFDPVPDPRESWKDWLVRNIDFKDAPLVQRNSLPIQLQPQNRKLGKIDILVQNWVKSDSQVKSSYQPKLNRQVMSEMNQLVGNTRQKTSQHQYQSAS